MTVIRQVIGRVGLALKGEWDSTSSYDKLDVVEKDGSSYSSKVDGNTSVPGMSDTWQLLAEKGTKGDQGYSAYEIAVQHGYTGTEAEYNALYFDAVANADAKAGLANDAAALANEKATAANDAATLANTKAGLANDAAALADAKAGLANDAAALANEKATAANDAATLANTKAGLANDAAALADAKAGLADAAATAANAAAQGAEDVNAQLNGSVVTITNRLGQSSSIDLMNAAEENVVITVTSTAGTATGGLGILMYLNDSSMPQTITTDNHGLASVKVPQGYKYRLVFPRIAGTAEIPDVVHIASVTQRSVEVVYQPEVSMSEVVTVTLRSTSYTEDSTVPIYGYMTGANVTVVYGGVSHVYVTDSNGVAAFSVPIGTVYEVQLPQESGYYVRENNYTRRLTAQMSQRNITVIYSGYRSGLYIMDINGNEYTLAQWQERLTDGDSENSDAKMLVVTTVELSKRGMNFLMDLDDLSNRNYASLQWSRDSVQFNSIPNSDQRWDGLADSRAVQAEGVERSIPTPAFDDALGKTRTIAGVTYQGYLGAIQQWYQLWPNAAEIDAILAVVRPNGSPFSTYTVNKWSSSQSIANSAWSWTTVANSSNKSGGFAVVPFFAY